MTQKSCFKKLYMSLLLFIFSHDGQTNTQIDTNINVQDVNNIPLYALTKSNKARLCTNYIFVSCDIACNNDELWTFKQGWSTIPPILIRQNEQHEPHYWLHCAQDTLQDKQRKNKTQKVKRLFMHLFLFKTGI